MGVVLVGDGWRNGRIVVGEEGGIMFLVGEKENVQSRRKRSDRKQEWMLRKGKEIKKSFLQTKEEKAASAKQQDVQLLVI